MERQKERPYCGLNIRILDNGEHGLDVRKFIKSIETEYKFNFTTLPNWEKLVARLFARTTDLNREIQEASINKTEIVRKVLTEYTQPMPSASKWQDLQKLRKQKVSLVFDENSEDSSSFNHPKYFKENNDVNITKPTHHVSVASEITKKESLASTSALRNSFIRYEKPNYIITNEHVGLSPFKSPESIIKSTWKPKSNYESIFFEDTKEWDRLKPNKTIISNPNKIILKYDLLDEQGLKFSLLNKSSKIMYVRYCTVSNKIPFIKVIIHPRTNVTLYPGVPFVFKLDFIITKRKVEFTTSLFFRVGHNAYAGLPSESLCIPIITHFRKARSVLVPKELNIAPCYYWRAKYPNYPSATLHIQSNDDRYYHVYIVKKQIDLLNDYMTEVDSDTSSILVDDNIIAVEDKDSDVDDAVRNDRKKTKTKYSNTVPLFRQATRTRAVLNKIDQDRSTRNTAEELHDKKLLHKSIKSIVKEIRELALSTFLFESTYFFLKPDEKVKIKVELMKIQCMGPHNSFYELQFWDPKTKEIVIRKVIRVYGDILPHPIQVWPPFLDMSDSHGIYGFCKDRFMVKNNHKILTVFVEFDLPQGLKPKIYIKPRKTLISALQTVWFDIEFMSKGRHRKDDDVVHIKFQIVVSGYSVFSDAPSITFEVACPFKEEFLGSLGADGCPELEIFNVINN